MAQYKIIVLLNAVDGRAEDFNNWFTNTHLPDALKVPGIISGQRFQLTDTQREGASRLWQFLTVYDVETDDVANVIAELKRRQGTPEMVGTDTIAPGGFLHFFEPITELVTSEN